MKNTITIITGLPYSGKTTKAIELIKKSENISVRISPKDFTNMIGLNDSGLQGDLNTDGLFSLINYYTTVRNIDVVVDLDSLEPADVLRFKNLAKEFKVKFKHISLKTSMGTCIERAKKNNVNYRIPDIVNSALRYGLYKTKIVRTFYIVDVTYPETLNDKAFLKMEEAAKNKQDIILISTKPETERPALEAKLAEKKLFALGLPINTLIMAPKDNTKTHIATKNWIIKTYNLTKHPESQK